MGEIWVSSIILLYCLLFQLPKFVYTQELELPELSPPAPEEKTEGTAYDYSQAIEKPYQLWCTATTETSWNYTTNITDENQAKAMDISIKYATFKKSLWQNSIQWNWKTFTNQSLRRQFKYMSNIGAEALADAELIKYTNITTEMGVIYGTARVCDYKDKTKCDLSLTPDLEEILQKSRDYDELEYVWTEWRTQSGKKMRRLYPIYIELQQQAAKLNDFRNAYEMWLYPYDDPNFDDEIMRLWNEVKPLYDQVHAYVRNELSKIYPDKFGEDGLIPAQLFGNMWGQNWLTLLDRTIPFKGKASVDVTDEMVAKGYTPLKMFQMADDFFTSIGFDPLPESFWRDSILEKPKDRKLECHATAWDFCNAKDFRIRMCTQVTMKDLVTAHHEVGHTIYHRAYSYLPQYFRDGANDGFHEAIGDCIAYSVSTPKHLKKVGLMNADASTDDPESEINYLYKEALAKIAFLPMTITIDVWRWELLKGNVAEEDYNCLWWKYRRNIQGFKPPNTRTSEDFDPGAKFHVPNNIPYIRYFISAIVQLQFHKTLCIAAGEYDPADPAKNPLHKCDIYGSKAAGDKLKSMLEVGQSISWQDALEAMTGSKQMSAQPLQEYFAPLKKWLIEQNEKNGVKVGWVEADEATNEKEKICVK